MKITVITLFPDMVDSVLSESMIGRAREKNILEVELINFRDFAVDKHNHVDDTPYGGGSGMVLRVEPIVHAIESVEGHESARKILLSPQGKRHDQANAKRLAREDHMIFICGHYEGFDERIRAFIDEELSLGDFVMTGGEIAAMAAIDSIIRLLPGVLGSEESYKNDSFYEGKLDYPQYTRPRSFRDMDVPDVLLSGNHAKIKAWREEKAHEKTSRRRPDLLSKTDKND
jgi:tRNA (guanine37-N1)-methyltransferase